MTSDYYFTKWITTLTHLENFVHVDLNYQTTKAHDQKSCGATQRLYGVFGGYSAIYNNILDCLQQNLQVQKTKYIQDVAKAVESRIIEIKHEIKKLECSNCQFVSYGITQCKLTSYDIELKDFVKTRRSEEIQDAIDLVFRKSKEKREALQRQHEEELQKQKAEETTPVVLNWWDTEFKDDENSQVPEEEEEKLSEATLERRKLIILIQSSEKSRQVAAWIRHREHRRRVWTKELEGTMPPPAPYNIREKSARLIQLVLRRYFFLKRKKIQDLQRDQMLGLEIRDVSDSTSVVNTNQIQLKRQQYEIDHEQQYTKMKEDFKEKDSEEIKEDYRDFIRHWFRQWFDEIQVFRDLPTINKGGIVSVIREDIPSPSDWREENQRKLEEKAANKKKTALQIKWEKMEAKREENLVKTQELKQKKLEMELKKKMMKNPNIHPGFNYPQSKQTNKIVNAIKNYKDFWNDLDATNSLDVKEKYVDQLNLERAYADAKTEIATTVYEDMKLELKTLKRALKIDYETNKEKVPEEIKDSKKPKRKIKPTKFHKEKFMEKFEELLNLGYLKEYPVSNLEDFVGDPNFAGEDFRCMYKETEAFNGDIRSLWWEICRNATRGFHKILLVGPEGCGRTRLVNILSSLNDAILIEVDPEELNKDLITPVYLKQLVNNVSFCAKAAQPAVIYLKDIQRLYLKNDKNDSNMNVSMSRRYLLAMLRKFHKTDKVTFIASCTDPWTAKSKMLKLFPLVFLMPNMSYSVAYQILKEWTIRNHEVPRDLDVHSLAKVFQGYSYGQLETYLQRYLTPERVLKIASQGLSTNELLEYIMKEDNEKKCDYTKYLKWYSEKTHWGKKEKKHLNEQIEFKMAAEKYAEKMEKTKISAAEEDKKKSPIATPDEDE